MLRSLERETRAIGPVLQLARTFWQAEMWVDCMRPVLCASQRNGEEVCPEPRGAAASTLG